MDGDKFYQPAFNAGEQADVQAGLPGGVHGEIVMLRVLMRRIFLYANEQAADLDEWRKVLGTLSTAAGRVAQLLRADQQLDQQADQVSAALSQALQTVLTELERGSK